MGRRKRERKDPRIAARQLVAYVKRARAAKEKADTLEDGFAPLLGGALASLAAGFLAGDDARVAQFAHDAVLRRIERDRLLAVLRRRMESQS